MMRAAKSDLDQIFDLWLLAGMKTIKKVARITLMIAVLILALAWGYYSSGFGQ